MRGTRYEAYAQLQDGLPFVLNTDILRNRHLRSKENNWHENIEIQFCTKGNGSVLLDGKKFTFTPNDIAVVNSNVLHYTGTNTELVYDVLIIDTAFCSRMGIDVTQTAFDPMPHSHDILRLYWKLKAVYNNTDAPCRTAILNKLLLEILIELTRRHSTQKPVSVAKNQAYEKVKRAIVYIRDNYHQKLSLDEIAKAALCDKYTLCKEFKKYTGQTVFENLHHFRCTKAIDLLRAGHTVAETAALCGFDNFSFFTKTFKKHIGKLPSAYKK